MANPRGNVATRNVAEGAVVPEKVFTVESPDEYKKSSAERGTIMGRKPDEKTKLTVEELRVLINEGWTPEDLKEKHGLDDEELKQVVWKLSKDEQREKPINFGKK